MCYFEIYTHNISKYKPKLESVKWLITNKTKYYFNGCSGWPSFTWTGIFKLDFKMKLGLKPN